MLRYDLLNVYVIGSLILTTVPSEGTLVVYPRNTAVVAGHRTTLNCTTITMPPLWHWFSLKYDGIAFSPMGPSQCVTHFAFESISRYRYVNIFDVSIPHGGSAECNLVILNATSSLADTYTCSDGSGQSGTGSAVLLVLDSGPQCSTNAVNNTVVHPGQVTMNCSVQYNSSSGWIPSLQWSSTGSTTSGSSGTTAYSTFTYNTSASTPIPSYSCSVVYNSSVFVDIQPCSTNPVTVLWCPRAATISGASGGYIAPGSSLTCSASGNPSPTYQWFNSTNNLLANGPSLTVNATGNYTCTASNNINGRLCSTSVSQFVNVSSIPVVTPNTPSTTANGGPALPTTTPASDCNCYNCGTRNPCTPQNINKSLFYFAHDNSTQYVQCSSNDRQCFIIPCQHGLMWDCDSLTCNWPMAIKRQCT